MSFLAFLGRKGHSLGPSSSSQARYIDKAGEELINLFVRINNRLIARLPALRICLPLPRHGEMKNIIWLLASLL